MTTTRAQLLEAKEHLSAAFAILDETGPELPEPERSSVCGIMGLKHDLSRCVRALGTICTTIGVTEGATTSRASHGRLPTSRSWCGARDE